jgi:methionyl-tRNA synthetase
VGSQLFPPTLSMPATCARAAHEVLFLCATDEHGTPAELAAAKAGKPVAEYCAEMWEVQDRLGKGFRLSFDHFGAPPRRRTTR